MSRHVPLAVKLMQSTRAHGDDAAGGEVVVYDTTGVDIKKKPGEAVLLEWLQVLQQHID